MRAKGLGPKEIEAILTEEKRAAKARMTQHRRPRPKRARKAAQARRKSSARWPTSTIHESARRLCGGCPARSRRLGGLVSWANSYAGREPSGGEARFERLIALALRRGELLLYPLELFPAGRRGGRARQRRGSAEKLHARARARPRLARQAIPATPNGSAISPSAIPRSATSAPPAATATARSKPIRTASTLQSSSRPATPPMWFGRRISL